MSFLITWKQEKKGSPSSFYTFWQTAGQLCFSPQFILCAKLMITFTFFKSKNKSYSGGGIFVVEIEWIWIQCDRVMLQKLLWRTMWEGTGEGRREFIPNLYSIWKVLLSLSLNKMQEHKPYRVRPIEPPSILELRLHNFISIAL